MQRQKTSIIIANILDHFDSNLYWFIAPIMAPLFFPKQNQIIQLILAYSFLATSSMTRPAGVLIFGWLTTHYDPWKMLHITLLGVGIATFLMGCLPTFASAGYYSAFALLAVRIIGGIFAEGERIISSIYLLENKTHKQAINTNTWLESSVVLGCAMASWTASCVSEHSWRLPFWFGGLLAFYALFLRYQGTIPGATQQQLGICPKPTLTSVLLVIFSGGLSYVTYNLSFVLMNTFVPLITNINRTTMMQWNTLLLLFDTCLFIPIGYFIWRYKTLTIKRLAALMLALPAIPLFYFMEGASLPYVLFVRFWIVTWGVVFACVLNVHLLSLFPYKHKYMWIGLGGAAGIALIGRSTPALCLWGFYKTHLAVIPGIYLCIVATMVLIFSRPHKKSGDRV